MPSDLLTLDTVFNNRIFRIPDYQRGYAWGKKQLGDFWEDLDKLDEDRKHYTGQITVEPASDEHWKKWDEETWLISGRNFRPFFVVDGQQRLTTSIILLHCILDATPDGQQLAFTDKADHSKKFILQNSGVSKAYLFGYERDNPSYKCLKSEILGQHDGSPAESETLYTANLRGARDFFLDQLKGASQADLDRWFRALTQRFLFSWHELQGDLDVFVVFETMNYRGKSLSKLELLKNRLIYLSSVLPAPATEDDCSALRRDINNSWSTIYSFLGKHHSLVLDDDEFLRAHWIMYFGYSREKAARFAEDLLDTRFTLPKARSGELKAAAIEKYVKSIRESAEAWFKIHHPERPEEHVLNKDVRKWLVNLKRNGRGAFAPLLMACLLKKSDDKNMARVAQAAERFNFLVSTLTKRKSNTGDNDFYRLSHEVHQGSCKLLDVISAIDRKTDQQFSLEKAMLEMSEESEGFYSWSGRYYFLYEYEQHVRAKLGMNSEKIEWDSFRTQRKDYYTIEHIYPRGAKSQEWPEFSALSMDDRGKLLHSLGNLLPLSTSRNSTFSNRPFKDKSKAPDSGVSYASGSYSEIEVSKQDNWTPTKVCRRGIELLEFLETRWRVSLDSVFEKKELLGLKSVTFQLLPAHPSSPDNITPSWPTS